MSKEGIDLECAERQLDRVQAFHPRIDSKVTGLLAIIAGQVAVLALNLNYGDLPVWWIAVPTAIFAAAVLYALFSLYRCTYPNLVGGANSLVYFREIAKLREAEFIEKYSALSRDEFKRDVVGQIWRNSEIVTEKYDHLKAATTAIMIGVLPWALVLAAIAIRDGRLPAVN